MEERERKTQLLATSPININRAADSLTCVQGKMISNWPNADYLKGEGNSLELVLPTAGGPEYQPGRWPSVSHTDGVLI